MLAATPRPQFDLCYFYGGHGWDNTGTTVRMAWDLLLPEFGYEKDPGDP